MRTSTFLLALSLAALLSCGEEQARRPNVLVILLDTLRADHLSVDGYARETSPNLDRFARENLHFPHAFTAAPWTPPSVATIFTGHYGSSHGMMPDDPPDGPPTGKSILKRLDESRVTMAELLKEHGYRTAAISSNPWIAPEFGYGQGFENYALNPSVTAKKVTEAGLAKIDEFRTGASPFFLYLHYLDPHAPYAPPHRHAIFEGQPPGGTYAPEMLKKLNLYDGEIRFLDECLGVLFEGLRERQLYDDLVIVVVGDHGEQFMERGYEGHGWQLFNEELRVPLVVKPGRIQGGRSVDRVVSTVDVLPTVLALTGLGARAGLHGVDLLDDRALSARRGVFAEIDRKLSLRAYVNASGKKIVVGTQKEGEEFDPADPAQSTVGVFDAVKPGEPAVEDADLLRELQSELADALRLAGSAKGATGSSEVVPSEETIKRLKSLGYGH